MSKRYFAPLLMMILAFSFFTRVYRLYWPETYMFDEVYHAVTAKLMAHNDPRAFEWWHPSPEPDTAIDWLHPPIAKYFQALSIIWLGETAFGWRFSSVIFGVLTIFLTAKVADLLFENKRLALLAALLASLDGLLLVQSRIAMNDIHVTFFILLTLAFYLQFLRLQPHRDRYLWLTGIAAGLAMGSKWSGIFMLLAVIVMELTRVKIDLTRILSKPLAVARTSIQWVAALVIIPGLIYVGSYWQMFGQGKSLLWLPQDPTLLKLVQPVSTFFSSSLDSNLFCTQKTPIRGSCYLETFTLGQEESTGYVSHFASLHKQILNYQTSLDAHHPYESRPWQWFWNMKPVWVYADFSSARLASGATSNIYAFGNPVLFWAGAVAVILSLIWIFGQSVLKVGGLKLEKTKISLLAESGLKPLSILLTSYFFVWLFWQFSPRIMFFYHYTPAVPLMSVLLAFWLDKSWRWADQIGDQMGDHPADQNHQTLATQTLAAPTLAIGLRVLPGLVVITTMLAFIIWFPHWTGLPVSSKLINSLYYFFTSWK